MTRVHPSNPPPRVLIVSFAFPPIQVQMSPLAARIVAELDQFGLAVDVVASGPGSWPLPVDENWNAYIAAHVDNVLRIEVINNLSTRPRRLLRRLIDLPDPMIRLVGPARREILSRGSDRYAAILSISPFHSVNRLMIDVKRAWPHLPWIAYFGDPWAQNPLEMSVDIKLWNRWMEPRALRAADIIVQSSRIALERLQERYSWVSPTRMRHVQHTFDGSLYPKRIRATNERFTFRFVGTLFGRRSPLPILMAMRELLTRRPELQSMVAVELIGPVERLFDGWNSGVLSSVVSVHPPVPYFKSLELMYDADALLMIEADIPYTPFMPSKLTDYLGADTPILGIVPRGECRDVLAALGAPVHDPGDIEGIAASIETMVERPRTARSTWCDQKMRRSFDLRVRQDGLAAIVREACGA